jgi:hypothetical protein
MDTVYMESIYPGRAKAGPLGHLVIILRHGTIQTLSSRHVALDDALVRGV